ncbi:MAG TPA: TRAP transporter large permease subunit [Sphaerochaetaceae bacterium]|nr:TRAP transporter large permease subunit [Sphaerochaetaceae bacterium]
MFVLILFTILLAIGVPIGISTGMSAMLFMHFEAGRSYGSIIQAMFSGVDSFALMAIPFFIFAGDIMLKGGVSKRLIDFAKKLIGWTNGGLPITGVISSMFFAALSGSAPATVAAIGGIMIPSMEEAKYEKRFAVGLMCASGSLGIIIPPSITLLVYGVISEQSIAQLFLAGIVPGILIGLMLMIAAYFISRKQPYEKEPFPHFKEVLHSLRKSFWGLMMPLIVLGGIYLGVFTPTESAAVAVVYSLAVSLFVYKELKLSEVMAIARKSVTISAVIMFIIANATVLSRYLTFRKVPTMLAEFILQYASTPFTLLLFINLLLLVVGMIMDPSAAVTILAPLFLPAVMALGVNPIHFGVIMIVNLAIGMVTPPFGLNLYVASGISKMSVSQVTRAVLPFIALLLGALMLITYIPQLSLMFL